MNRNSSELLNALSQPFHPAHITWKPGVFNRDKSKALALAYADLRAYQQRLDEVCGMNWSVSYRPWGERIICELTIAGVTRSSTGEPDAQSEKSEIAGTAAEAQAFKRACAMFGLGRYLYTLPTVWAEFDKDGKQFTERSKARLAEIVAQHYRRHLDPAAQEEEAQAPAAPESQVGTSSAGAKGKQANDHAGKGQPAARPQGKPDQPKEALVAEQRSELEELAKLYYEDKWETELKRLAGYMSGGRTEDHTSLLPAETTKLISGLAQKLQARKPALS